MRLVVPIVVRNPRRPEVSDWLAGAPVNASPEEGVWHAFPSLREAFRFALESFDSEGLWGTVSIGDDYVAYATASGKGVYVIAPDLIAFAGRRRSFEDGCPPIHLRLVAWHGGRVALYGDIYGDPGDPFLGTALVAHFELPDVKVFTSHPETFGPPDGWEPGMNLRSWLFPIAPDDFYPTPEELLAWGRAQIGGGEP